MEIRSISEKIFKLSPSKTEMNNNQTNPFGVSFKGNMVSADVFEAAAKKTGLIEKVSNRSKMVMSAIVGSVNGMNQAISSRLDSVVSFGKRMGERVTTAWNCLNPKNLKENFEMVEKKSIDFLKTNLLGNSYKNKSVEELSCILEELTNARVQEAIA